MSLSHAIALAEAARRKLHCAYDDPTNHAVTPAEIAQGKAEKAKIQAALNSTISSVDLALASLRKTAPRPTTNTRRAPKNALTLSRAKAGAVSVAQRTLNAQDTDPALDAVQQALSADGMTPSVNSLQKMATAIEPVIDDFDNVLKQPYLENFDATLNTVPIVGLKGTQIMYIEAQPGAQGGPDVTYSWSYFADLPADAVAKITPSNKVYMFPYKGDFYLSVGTSIWTKAHRSDGDPAIKSAVDNWPALYVDEWRFIGDNTLPAVDLAGVIPFAVLSADRQTTNFYLITLASDGSLSYLVNDIIIPGAKYQSFTYKPSSGTPATPPKFTKAAYWDGKVVAVDDQSNLWNLTPSFNDGSYTISDMTPIDPVTEFTANDQGPVGLRSDGYLYIRTVQPPPAGSTDDATLQWTRWIQANGVTNLGCASPGVRLDLRTLTNTLRSRYIDVQTSVYPVVNTINTFAAVHGYYLGNVYQDAITWQTASSEEQKTLAINNAKTFVTHAQTWSKIVSASVAGAKESVNVMTTQLHDVRVQLEQELARLQYQLKGLQATLNDQEQALSTLKAALWGCVGAIIFAILLLIAGVFTGNVPLLVAGGVLFFAGLITGIVLTVEYFKLESAISDTQGQIESVQTAITNLTTVVSEFTDLDSLYGTLNDFWGGMANNASSIQTMDDATAYEIGAKTLADVSSIQAAQQKTTDMASACQTYLEVLNKQGINVPSGSVVTSFAVHKSETEARFHGLISRARDTLLKRDTSTYTSVMQEAGLTHAQAIAENQKANIASGSWFDLPALSSSANIWMFSDHTFSRSVQFPSGLRTSTDPTVRALVLDVDHIDSSLDQTRPALQQTLASVITLGETIEGWNARYPTIPTDSTGIDAVMKLRVTAIEACLQAQQRVAMASARFADFANEVNDYTQILDQLINASQAGIQAAQDSAANQIRNLRPPWYVVLAGAVAVAAWIAQQTAEINSKLKATINNLESDIAQFTQLQQSGNDFDRKAQAWIDMTQNVSRNLDNVYNILAGIWGDLLKDPALYAELVNGEWTQLSKDAKSVLVMLSGGIQAELVMAAIAQGTRPSLAATVFANPSKDAVMKSLSPNGNLSLQIRSQASSAQELHTKLELLLKAPYFKDIIGYWEDGQTIRKTLLDVSADLQSQYVGIIGSEYEVIQSIASLSILQAVRAKTVVDGTLSLEDFVKFTSQSVQSALQAAQRTSTQYGSASAKLQVALNVIQKNIEQTTNRIVSLGTSLDNLDKDARDQLLWDIANIIALTFAGASILVAFGVVGPIIRAVTLAVQLGASATSTAASIKLVLDSLSSADITKTIDSLKSLVGTLNSSVTDLKTASPSFGGVVDGVNGLTASLTTMQKTLSDVLANSGGINDIEFNANDANVITAIWAEIRQDTTVWMAAVKAQGISPVAV